MRSITSCEPARNPPSEPSVLDSVPIRTRVRSGVVHELGRKMRAEDGVRLVDQEERAVLHGTESAISSTGAASPSMEKTVSVTTIVGVAGIHLQQRGEMRHVAVPVDRQLGARQPATVDDRGVVQLVREHPHLGAAQHAQAPRLAAKPVGKQMAASVPFQSARAVSSAVCTGREPVTSREAPAPVPQRSSRVDRRGHHGRVRRSGPGSRWRRRRRPCAPSSAPCGPKASNSRGCAPPAAGDDRIEARPHPVGPDAVSGAGPACGVSAAASAITSRSPRAAMPSRASMMRTISSSRGGQGRHDHDHVAQRAQQHAAGDGAGADPAAPAQARPGWRQLHADHEPPLAHFAHAGEGGDALGEKCGQLIGAGLDVGQDVPRLDESQMLERHRRGQGVPAVGVAVEERLRSRGQRPRKASNTSPEATVADMARYPPVIPLPRHSRSGRSPHCSEAKRVPVRPKPVATSSQIKQHAVGPAGLAERPDVRRLRAEHARGPLHQGLDHDGGQLARRGLRWRRRPWPPSRGRRSPGVRSTGKHSGSNTALKTPPSPRESEPMVSP